MKCNVIAITGSSSGSWVALCASHAARYAENYGKTVKVHADFWYDCTEPECVACDLAATLERQHKGGYIYESDLAEINRRAGCHFFSADSMRFFSGKIATSGQFLPGDWLSVAFVTSEKREGFRAEDGPRLYTVRLMDCLTGYIREDPAGFQGYATLDKARRALARVLTAGRLVEVSA